MCPHIPTLQFVFDKAMKNKSNGHRSLYLILGTLFGAKVKYVNTKEIPLISNGLIKKTKAIKQFLYELSPTLLSYRIHRLFV